METPNLIKKIRNIYGYSAKNFIAKKSMFPVALLTIVFLIISFACSDSEDVIVYSVSALNEDGLEKVLGKSVESFIDNSDNCKFVAAEDTGTSYNLIPTRIEGIKNKEGVSFTQSSKKQADVPYGFYATCDKISSIGNMQNMRVPDLEYQEELFENVGILQNNLCDGITNYINSKNTSSSSGGSGSSIYSSSGNSTTNNSTTNDSNIYQGPYYNSKPTVTLTFSQDAALKYILNATMDKASITPSNVAVAEYWLYDDASFTKGGTTNTVGFGEVASTDATKYVFENLTVKPSTNYYLVGRHKYKALNNVTYYSSWSDTKSIMPGRLAHSDSKLTVNVSDISANKIIYNFYKNNANIAFVNIPAVSYTTNTTATEGNLAVGGGLTLQESPTFNATGGRRSGAYYTLNGSNQYIKSKIGFAGATEFTIVWSYKGASGDTPQSLFRYQPDYHIILSYYGNAAYSFKTPDDSSSKPNQYQIKASLGTTSVTDGTWHELAMTWKGGSPPSLSAYLDGQHTETVQGSYNMDKVPPSTNSNADDDYTAIGAFLYRVDQSRYTAELMKGNVGYGLVVRKALSAAQIKSGYDNGYENTFATDDITGGQFVNFENRFVKDYVSNQGVDLRDVAWVKKDNEGALYFNGYDNYMDIASAPSVSSDFTLLLWIYPLEYPSSDNDKIKEICSWYNTSDDKQAQLRFDNLNILKFILYDSSVSSSNFEVNFSDNKGVTLKTWQLVGVKKSGNQYTLILNDQSVTQDSSDYSFSTSKIQIGRKYSDTTYKSNTHYSGYMKNILYFKHALSDQQITSIRTNNGLKEIVSEELKSDEKWNVQLTPITNNVDGTGITSNTVQIQ